MLYVYSKKLKRIRDIKAVYAKDLADYIGVSKAMFSDYENENKIFPIKHICKIADYLDISIDYLFSLTEKINYQNCKRNIDIKLSGYRLKEFRKEHELKQKDLAKILACSSNNISDYETGKYYISTYSLYIICKKYKISADYLLGKVDEPKYLK